MEVSGEAADLVMKEGVQISEEAIKLLARGAKNLAALLYALAKDQKKLYGKVNMNRLLSEQRPIEVLPLRTEDFDEFKRRAKKVGLLFSTILDKKGGGRAAKKRAAPCSTRTILAKAKQWLDAGDDFDQ